MTDRKVYAPIFKGRFPPNARAKWKLIHKFVDLWCGTIEASREDSRDVRLGLVAKAEAACDGKLSYSVREWLTLLENAAAFGVPVIRDCPAVEPIEDSLNNTSVRDATVILIAGESDVYWAVENVRLTEDDPPVDTYQNYDPSSPAFIGRTNSVSEFSFKYICMYNEFAVGNREWFSANCSTENESSIVRDWFEYSLAFDSDDEEWCDRFELLESQGIAAIVRGEHMDVSIFCDPATLKLPRVLQSEMNDHLDLRRSVANPIKKRTSVAKKTRTRKK